MQQGIDDLDDQLVTQRVDRSVVRHHRDPLQRGEVHGSDDLGIVDEFVLDGGIGESTWQTLAEHLDVQQILDLIFTIGSYDTLARMFTSLQLGIDADIVDLMKLPTTPPETDDGTGHPV